MAAARASSRGADLLLARLLRPAAAMTPTLTAKLEDHLDDATLRHVRDEVRESNPTFVPESTAPEPTGRLSRFFENAVAKRFGHRQLVKLAADRGRVARAWRELPDRMHLVANQTKLMMELIDDFRSGSYRSVSWKSVAIAAGAVLYVANPGDVLPDVLMGVGLLDDIAVAALAARTLRKELEAYCRFKGYSFETYFPAEA